METKMMWVWWTFTIAICAWKILEGLLRPQRMLEWPFLAAAMWAYFFGYMAYNAQVGMPEYLGNGMSNIGQLMPLLCLVGILIGWALGTRIKRYPAEKGRTYRYFHFWMAGVFFLVVGAVGGYTVMRAAAEGNLDFKDSSGYWILLFYVGYPGLAMTIWALLQMPRGASNTYRWIITVVVLIAFLYPHVSTARRGPLFPALMVLLLIPPLTRRRSPNPLVFCGCLAALGLIMLIFLQVRVVTYNGGSWTEALHHLDLSTAVTEKVDQPEDNEYINNCQQISTIYQNGKYQYGTGHLSLLWHWIPRAVWKDKPTLGEGLYSNDEMFDDIEAATGFRLLGTGAASTGVADTFVQYGVLCPLFWLGVSWGMGAVYVRARIGNSPRWLFCYVGFICATHWLVSQGFAAAFVPGMFFQAVPIIVFALLDPPHLRHAVADLNRRAARTYSTPKRALPS